jgi:cytochrome b pre-mRNA-processing protein 3
MTREQQPQPAGAIGTWWRRWRAAGQARVARREAAYRLYVALVGRARSPLYFQHLGVPDIPEGRFEMIALHGALVLRRLRAEGQPGMALGRELLELMVADFDVNLREIGIGDLSVGKYVKRLARNVNARLAALDRSLDAGDGEALRAMIARNAYQGGPPPRPDQIAALADHLIALDAGLKAVPGAALLQGELPSDPPGKAIDPRLEGA